MNITEIEAKSILRKYKKIDSWFISHYGMNLYRGCSHNCLYCDGRAEGYYVEGEFGKDVAVKINGIEILARELDPARKRRPFKQSFIMVGAAIGVDFIIFSGMTLKQGRQQEYFLNTLRTHYPELVSRYRSIYRGDRWGQPTTAYYSRINRTFSEIADRYKIPKRVPLPVFRDILSENDLVIVLLEHIDYQLKLQGGSSPFGYAAYSISKLKEPLSEIKEKLLQIRGVNRNTQAIILEILATGSSAYYRKLAVGGGQ